MGDFWDDSGRPTHKSFSIVFAAANNGKGLVRGTPPFYLKSLPLHLILQGVDVHNPI